MRAHGRQGRVGKRFTAVISVIAAGLMALGAETAAATPFDTMVSINQDRGRLIHGWVKSKADRCEADRRWALFKKRPGTDRKLGSGLAEPSSDRAVWGMVVPKRAARHDWHLYVMVPHKVRRHEVLCLGDRAGYTVGDVLEE